jgi:hypothetical protein
LLKSGNAGNPGGIFAATKEKMRPLVTLLLFAALAAGCQSENPSAEGAQASSASGPMFRVDKEVHDFGTLKMGADGSCVFTVTNTGSEPLIISKCEKTCGCTVPACDPAPIAPGGKSEIKVTYDTKRMGPFNKNVKVFCNSQDGGEKTLRVKGEIIE